MKYLIHELTDRRLEVVKPIPVTCRENREWHQFWVGALGVSLTRMDISDAMDALVSRLTRIFIGYADPNVMFNKADTEQFESMKEYICFHEGFEEGCWHEASGFEEICPGFREAARQGLIKILEDREGGWGNLNNIEDVEHKFVQWLCNHDYLEVDEWGYELGWFQVAHFRTTPWGELFLAQLRENSDD